MMRWLRVLLLLLAAVSPSSLLADVEPPVWAETRDGTATVHLYFFWSRYCPHCQEALPFVEGLEKERPWLRLHSLEVTGSEENRIRYRQMAAAFGETASTVPAFFFAEQMVVGFDTPDGMGRQLARALDAYHAQLTGGAAPPVSARQEAAAPPVPEQLAGLEGLSLPLMTVAIAGLDAFNPCAFFVLLFLLSLLVHVGSRRRMLLIGGVFVLFSGLIYFLFMAAWLNVFLLFGQLRAVTLAAGLVAVTMALLNIKDFVRPNVGPSLSISDEAKPNLYRRVRGLLHADRLPTLLLGTVALAIAANSYELLCTSGLPMVYTRILTLEALPQATYYLYLALYNLVYVLPLAVIVAVFTYTLGSRKLQPEEGRILKLLSGTMMLGLGGVLLFAPNELQNLGVAFGIILAAVAVAGFAWWSGRRHGV